MKDADGRVTIDGWNDGVSLDAEDLKVLRAVPDDEPAIRRQQGIAASDGVGSTLQEAIQYPSLNIRGLASAWVGEQTRTVIPGSATAEIDIRLVLESDAERLLRLLRAHIEDQGYRVLDGAPTEDERLAHPRLVTLRSSVAYAAFRSEFDSLPGRWLQSALTRWNGSPPIRIRGAGGSIPIAPFVAALGVPAVVVPTVNPDNNQHSPNENLRVGDFVHGIGTILAVLSQPLSPQVP
jgi:acetylornithine deacetylase/succinyl-diaminopimelate desuccinylase-like protein